MRNKNNFQSSSPYSMHVIAIARMLEWFAEARKLRFGCAVRDSMITFDDSISQRFALGFPRTHQNKGKNKPFLGIQSTERFWMEPMQWHKAYVIKNKRILYLVTKSLASEDERNENLPCFAVGITVNDADKLLLFFRHSNETYIEGKEMWFNENNEAKVNLRESLFSIPLTLLEADSPLPLYVGEEVEYDNMTLQEKAVQKSNTAEDNLNNTERLDNSLKPTPPMP